ncbi:MAG: DUF167 domain-containing protein [Deltaproteobacteria bacterium]|nr:DUF167 domain-containing protein [Deltaproteobacteria bacterium]
MRRADGRGGDPRREDHQRLAPARSPPGGEHPRAARPARRAGGGAQECDRDPPRTDREPHPRAAAGRLPAGRPGRGQDHLLGRARHLARYRRRARRVRGRRQLRIERESLSRAPTHLALQIEPERIGFFIHVTPRAKSQRLGPRHGDALRVAVLAPPVEGRANAACMKVLAEALGVPRGAVEIDPAARSRRKRVWVAGDPKALGTRLQALASGE